MERKKTIKILPPPILEIPTQHYQSNWLISIKKISNGQTQVTISFEGVSNEMKIEIENYIKEKASDGFKIKKFKSTYKLEAELVNNIKKNNEQSYIPPEIGPSYEQ